MNIAELLTDGFGRVVDVVNAAVDGLSVDQLASQVAPGTNTIGWLVWHLARVQDDHVSDAAGIDQIWTTAGWAERFALPFDDTATGYAQDVSSVVEVRVSAEHLVGYLEAVTSQTRGFLEGLRDPDLDRIVDESWDPPVTLGVRLLSVISDDLQHGGQAAFVRGILLRDHK